MNIIRKIIPSSLLLIMLIYSGITYAGERIAILSFELNDITSLPNTKAEQIRTASIKPLLEQAMKQIGNYDIIQISSSQQKSENAGLGYLFRFHDIAAKLAEEVGADWLVVGQHSKPSFLYSYLMVYLIDVKTAKLVARYDIELKGNHNKVTQRGVIKLARKINKDIDR